MAQVERHQEAQPDGIADVLRVHLVDPVRLARLRADVRRFLSGHGVDAVAIDNVVLSLTELVTNGYEATTVDGQVAVELDCSRADVITLAVTNRPARPTAPLALASVAMPGPDAARGRGLPLVAAFATRLSIDAGGERTQVRVDFAR